MYYFPMSSEVAWLACVVDLRVMSLGGLEEAASARTRFAEFLLSISNCPAYFFVISGGEEDQLSSPTSC